MKKAHAIRTKRIYVHPAAEDGIRILVDRLWPRGVKKEDAHIEAWLKDIAPSDSLRHWFGHDPERWIEFKRRYAAELSGSKAKEGIEYLRNLSAKGRITMVYSATDEMHNNAVALQEYLLKGSEKRG